MFEKVSLIGRRIAAYSCYRLAAMSVVLASMGCAPSASMIHLIHAGYVGPVVIVFERPSDGTLTHMEGEAVVYEIPSDGVLRLRTPPPKPGWYKISYFYVRPDGSRQKIPYHADEGALQVFADVVGTTAEQKGGRSTTWTAYVVGIPKERNDWVALRTKATEAAVGMAGLQ